MVIFHSYVKLPEGIFRWFSHTNLHFVGGFSSYPLVNQQFAIVSIAFFCGFTHQKWWFSSSLCKRLPGRVAIAMFDDLAEATVALQITLACFAKSWSFWTFPWRRCLFLVGFGGTTTEISVGFEWDFEWDFEWVPRVRITSNNELHWSWT